MEKYLYHYYERGTTPFRSLSDLDDETAIRVQNGLKAQGNIYELRDSDGMYMVYRRRIEARMREQFARMGGSVLRDTPRYMLLGACDRCRQWYTKGVFLRIPLVAFDLQTVSFTYGDSFPTFDPSHGDTSEYRQRVYTYAELPDLIERFGFPQDTPWTDDTPYWQPGYIEAQIWGEVPIDRAEYEIYGMQS